MRRVSVLLAGLAALVGTPAMLLSFTVSPWVAVGRVFRSSTIQSPIDRGVAVLGFVLWLAWAWVVASTIRAAIQYRRGDDMTTVASNRLVVMFVLAMWVSLVPRAVSGPPVPTNHATESGLDHSRSETSRSVLPLALTTSAFAVSHVLRSVGQRRSSTLRRMPAEQQFRAVGAVESALWRTLRMVARRPATPTPVFHPSRIPIGVRDGSVVTIDVEHGACIGIQGRSDAETRAVARHTEWMMENMVDGSSVPRVVIGFGAGQHVQIAQDDLGWRVVATGERFDAFGVSDREQQLVTRLLDASVRTELRRRRSVAANHRVLVRLMGPVLAESAGGMELTFGKSRSVELLAWLVTHRDRPTRAAARTAMWESDVRNATFNNIVSDLRTGLQQSFGGSGRDSIVKSFDDHLRFDEGIVSDVDLLERALHDFVSGRNDHGRDNLFAALRMVNDMPFLGADYLWPDPEGITSNIVHLVVTASKAAAEDALERDDVDGVFFATGRGLRVLHNHEGLIGLRMRAYAKQRDFAGVRQEWERYAAVPEHGWEEDGLMQLRDELLGLEVVR